MARRLGWNLSGGVLCLALAMGMIATQFAEGASVSFEGVAVDQTDFSPSGLNLGTSGFWFAQFNASAPISGAAVNDNDRNSLPSWVTAIFNDPDPDEDNSFSSSATSKGGQTAWASLTLPDGEMGLSGAVVDSNTADNSNNTIRRLVLGPGTPKSFLMHVVTDNTNNEHNPAGRLRARGEQPEGGEDADFRLTSLDFNGIPDVYTFRYDDFGDGGIIKMQLNDGGTSIGFPPNVGASIAGLMFDVVPEPSSIALVLLGVAGGVCGLRLRRK